jgi:hypothetical protein
MHFVSRANSKTLTVPSYSKKHYILGLSCYGFLSSKAWANNYRHALRNIQEKWESHLDRGGSLTSRFIICQVNFFLTKLAVLDRVVNLSTKPCNLAILSSSTFHLSFMYFV